MPKFKPHRAGIRIDMTPLVDVAFLLLTFFMLTTQFKPPEEVQITLPQSNSEIKLPESNVITLTLSKDGRIFMGLSEQSLRARLFGKENELKGGIEVTKERLPNLLIQARTANFKLITVVKGDKEAEYGLVEDVMNILQETKITKFNLVTNFESGQ